MKKWTTMIMLMMLALTMICAAALAEDGVIMPTGHLTPDADDLTEQEAIDAAAASLSEAYDVPQEELLKSPWTEAS